jgi:hypothetical protein
MIQRFKYLLAAVATIVAGLGSRRYSECLPPFIAEYAGDTLWALMLFLLISVVLEGRSLVERGAISLVLAFLVEVSQLYHAPWLDSIRDTTLGRLILGAGFLWTDLICYTVGIAVGMSVEALIINRKRKYPLIEPTT